MKATLRSTVSKQVRKPVFLVNSHFVELPVHYMVLGQAWDMYLETLRSGIRWQIVITLFCTSTLESYRSIVQMGSTLLEDLGTSPAPFRKVLGIWFQAFTVG